jgi:hypothetical protein
MFKEIGQLKADGFAKNEIINSVEQYVGNFGGDDFHLTRLTDVKDNDIKLYGTENLSVIDRALRAGVVANTVLSFHRAIMAVQVRGLAEQIIHKAVAFIKSGAEDAHLDDMGIDKAMRDEFRTDLTNIATFKGDKLVSLNFDNSKLSPERIADFSQAVLRGSSQIIQKSYIGETGRWANDGFLKMLFQFRTFGITSIEKQWGRNVANHGTPKAFAYLLGSMSFAAPIYMARQQLKTIGMSRSEREKYLERNLQPLQIARATMNYASASGLAGDIMDVGGGFASAFGGDGGKEYAESVGARGQDRQNLIGGVLGPGAGIVQDAWAATHGNTHSLMRIIPGSNLPMVQPLLNVAKGDTP